MHENVILFVQRLYIHNHIQILYVHIYCVFQIGLLLVLQEIQTPVLGFIKWKDTTFIIAAEFLRLQRNHK